MAKSCRTGRFFAGKLSLPSAADGADGHLIHGRVVELRTNLHEICKCCYNPLMLAISTTRRVITLRFGALARAWARIARRHFDSRSPGTLSVRRHDQGTLACLGRAR